MKNSLRKGLIATLTGLIAILVMFIVITNVNFVRADGLEIPSDANAPRVAGEWTDDFYVEDAASVRIETEGIKFTTVLSKAYMQELTKNGAAVEFFATAKRDGGVAQAVAFKQQPTVATMDDTFYLNTYLNFNNYTGDMVEACSTDFIIETYAKITDGSEVTYVRAYKPDGNDIARSMQAVANTYYLETGDTDITQYFTVGNRSNDVTGYLSLEDGSSRFTMPKLELEGTATAYVGTKKFSGAVNNDGELVINGLDVNGLNSLDKIDVSVFSGNTVYSTKIQAVDLAVTNSNVDKLLTVTSGYVVIAEDIDMSTAYTANNGVWTTTAEFSGVLDGQGHKITNFKTNTGLFKRVAGTIKNLAILDATLTGSGASLLATSNLNGNLTVDNVIFTVGEVTGNAWTGASALVETYNTYSITVKNSILSNPTTHPTNKGGLGCGGIVAAQINGTERIVTFENSYLVGYSAYIVYYDQCSCGRDPHVAGTYNTYDDVSGLVEAFKNGQVTNVSDMIISFVADNSDIVKITNENVAELLTATGGYVVIAEDIDMSTAYTAKNGVWTTTAIFNGVLDGQGHKITNFKTDTGLFKRVAGTIKNLAILDATLTGSGASLLATSNLYGNLTVDNVIFTVGEVTGNAWTGASALVETYNAYSITVKNSILSNPTTHPTNKGGLGCGGIVAAQINGTERIVTFENTYLVGNSSYIVYRDQCSCGRDPHVAGTYNTYDDVSGLVEAFKNGQVTNVSDMIIEFIEANKN